MRIQFFLRRQDGSIPQSSRPFTIEDHNHTEVFQVEDLNMLDKAMAKDWDVALVEDDFRPASNPKKVEKIKTMYVSGDAAPYWRSLKQGYHAGLSFIE